MMIKAISANDPKEALYVNLFDLTHDLCRSQTIMLVELVPLLL
jgi:hypothetical protein